MIIPIRSKFLEESFQKRGIFGYYGTICEVIAAKLGCNKTREPKGKQLSCLLRGERRVATERYHDEDRGKQDKDKDKNKDKVVKRVE